MFYFVYNQALACSSFEELSKKLEGIPLGELKKGAYNISAAGQLASEGNLERVEWLRLLGADVSLIAMAYARANNDAQVAFYEWNHSADPIAICMGYALAGNIEKVTEYCTQYNLQSNHITKSLAAGGYPYIDEYYEDNEESAQVIMDGYAIGEHHEQLEKFRKKHSIKPLAAAEAYEYAKNSTMQKKYDIHFLLTSYIEERNTLREQSGSDYFYGSFFAPFQKSYTQKIAAVIALQHALDGKKVNLSEHLATLRNGRLGNQLRELIKLGVADSLVGKEVTTVTDFVQALEANNSSQEFVF